MEREKTPESEDSGVSVDGPIISRRLNDGGEVRWYRPILPDFLRIALYRPHGSCDESAAAATVRLIGVLYNKLVDFFYFFKIAAAQGFKIIEYFTSRPIPPFNGEKVSNELIIKSFLERITRVSARNMVCGNVFCYY